MLGEGASMETDTIEHSIPCNADVAATSVSNEAVDVLHPQLQDRSCTLQTLQDLGASRDTAATIAAPWLHSSNSFPGSPSPFTATIAGWHASKGGSNGPASRSGAAPTDQGLQASHSLSCSHQAPSPPIRPHSYNGANAAPLPPLPFESLNERHSSFQTPATPLPAGSCMPGGNASDPGQLVGTDFVRARSYSGGATDDAEPQTVAGEAADGCGAGRSRGRSSRAADGGEGAAERARRAHGRASRELVLLDPKRAKRILANRMSAAKSKERKHHHMEQLTQMLNDSAAEQAALTQQRDRLTRDAAKLEAYVTEAKHEAVTLTATLGALRARQQALQAQLFTAMMAAGQNAARPLLEAPPGGAVGLGTTTAVAAAGAVQLARIEDMLTEPLGEKDLAVLELAVRSQGAREPVPARRASQRGRQAAHHNTVCGGVQQQQKQPAASGMAQPGLQPNYPHVSAGGAGVCAGRGTKGADGRPPAPPPLPHDQGFVNRGHSAHRYTQSADAAMLMGLTHQMLLPLGQVTGVGGGAVRGLCADMGMGGPGDAAGQLGLMNGIVTPAAATAFTGPAGGYGLGLQVPMQMPAGYGVNAGTVPAAGHDQTLAGAPGLGGVPAASAPMSGVSVVRSGVAMDGRVGLDLGQGPPAEWLGIGVGGVGLGAGPGAGLLPAGPGYQPAGRGGGEVLTEVLPSVVPIALPYASRQVTTAVAESWRP